MSFTLVTLGTKFVYFLGSVLLAGILSTGSGGATGANGGAIQVPDFTTSGRASTTQRITNELQFSAFVRGGTGSTLR